MRKCLQGEPGVILISGNFYSRFRIPSLLRFYFSSNIRRSFFQLLLLLQVLFVCSDTHEALGIPGKLRNYENWEVLLQEFKQIFEKKDDVGWGLGKGIMKKNIKRKYNS